MYLYLYVGTLHAVDRVLCNGSSCVYVCDKGSSKCIDNNREYNGATTGPERRPEGPIEQGRSRREMIEAI